MYLAGHHTRDIDPQSSELESNNLKPHYPQWLSRKTLIIVNYTSKKLNIIANNEKEREAQGPNATIILDLVSTMSKCLI